MIKGDCLICKEYKDINFEHVPPKSCGNHNTKYNMVLFKDLLVPFFNKNLPKFPNQGGIGVYAFCKDCNGNFGKWYVRSYSDWYKEAVLVLKIITKTYKPLAYSYKIYPLRIIKEIICMFIAINKESSFFSYKDELCDFVAKKDQTSLPSGVKVWAYYNFGGKPRINSFVNFIKFNGNNSIMSEIAFPPFGFVLTLNCQPPDKRLIDISYFANYEYTKETTLHLDFPVLPTNLKHTGTYLTGHEIRKRNIK